MPFLYPSNPGVSDYTDRSLALVYEFYEVYNASDSGYVDNAREDTLTYVVTMNNMIVILSANYYCDVPLGKNVDSWEIGTHVSIGLLSGVVNGSEFVHGYDCWTCLVEDGTLLAYDKETGVLIYGVWDDTDYHRTILLLEMNFTDPPRPFYLLEPFILSGIFLELAIVAWLFAFRYRLPRSL